MTGSVGAGPGLGPDLRAGLRLGLAAAGLVLLGVLLGPVALLVHGSWAPLVRLDAAVTRSAERAVDANPALLDTARGVTTLGDPAVVSALAALLALVLVRRSPRLALYVLAARIGAQLLSSVTKGAVDRARPVFAEPVASAAGASFPSGHALGASAFWLSAAVVALPLVARRRRSLLLAGALAVALAVAASRVLLGVHFLSDVTAGFLLGAGWVAVCTAVFRTWRREEGRPDLPLRDGLGSERAG